MGNKSEIVVRIPPDFKFASFKLNKGPDYQFYFEWSAVHELLDYSCIDRAEVHDGNVTLLIFSCYHPSTIFTNQ